MNIDNIVTFPMSETQTQPEEQSAVSNTANISLNDFVLMANIIAIAAKRGAFESKEFTVVGDLATRLDAFIKENSPPAEETEEVEDDGQLELELEPETEA